MKTRKEINLVYKEGFGTEDVLKRNEEEAKVRYQQLRMTQTGFFSLFLISLLIFPSFF
jgi:hypothetical protein